MLDDEIKEGDLITTRPGLSIPMVEPDSKIIIYLDNRKTVFVTEIQESMTAYGSESVLTTFWVLYNESLMFITLDNHGRNLLTKVA